MQSWRLLLHPDLPGIRQMAIDEALYRCLAHNGPPVLRFYTWRNPTLSLGYFQNYKAIVQDAFCVHNKIDVVRRFTGGRSVLHHEEVTYAVVASLEEGKFKSRTLQETYQLIARGLNLALQKLKVEEASVLSENSPSPPPTRSAQCFVSVSRYEISSGQKKIVGSAQKRSRDRFLQHGSILLDFDPILQAGCVQKADPEIEDRIAPLNRILNRKLTFEDVVAPFSKAFEEVCEMELEISDLTDAERMMAGELETKYLSDDWTQRGCR